MTWYGTGVDSVGKHSLGPSFEVEVVVKFQETGVSYALAGRKRELHDSYEGGRGDYHSCLTNDHGGEHGVR